jgi:hypothetical protein
MVATSSWFSSVRQAGAGSGPATRALARKPATLHPAERVVKRAFSSSAVRSITALILWW